MTDRCLTVLETLSVLKGLGMTMSRATLYRRIDDASFPRPVAKRGTKNLWSYGDVTDWHWIRQHASVRDLSEAQALQWADMNAGIREATDRLNANKVATRDELMRLYRKSRG